MKLINLLKYLRLPNLGLMLLVFGGVQFCLLPYLEVTSVLTTENFIGLSIAMVSIASFGNLQNDDRDLQIDAINQPKKADFYKKIGLHKLRLTYWILGGLGIFVSSWVHLALGFYVHNIIFIGSLVVLHLYNYYFKLSFLVGNLLISSLVALVFIMPFFYTSTSKSELTSNYQGILVTYVIFGFFFNLLREISKDIEDRRGDYFNNAKTMVIQLGISRCVKLTFWLTNFLSIGLVALYYIYFPKNEVSFLFLLSICVLLVFASIELQKKQTKINWKKLSFLLKIVMLLGSLSLYAFGLK